MLKRAGLYIRVSTDEQAKHGFSLAEQRADLEKYAQQHGYMVYDVYADEGNTARKAISRRRELQRLLADVKAGHVDIICFKCLDRWFRNIADYYKVQEILDQYHVDWECTQEEYNTTTTNGRLMLNLKLTIAQNESDQTSDRIKYVHQGNLRRKEELTGKHPYGYKLVDKKLAVVETDRPVIEYIFSQMLAGSSTHSLAQKVYEEFGISLASRRIWRILRNPTYKGERYGIADYCPAIIQSADFDKVQSILGYNRQPTRTGIPYYFSGKIVCPSCGNILVVNCGKSKKTGQYTRPTYICGNRYITGRPHDAGGCQFGGGVSEKVIEKYLLNNLQGLLSDYKAEITANALKLQGSYKDTVKQLEAKLVRLKDLYLDGLIDKATYKADYTRLKSEIAAAGCRASAQVQAPAALDLILSDSNFTATYEKLDRQHRRELWQSLIAKIEIIRRPEQKGQRYKDFKISFM